MEFNQFLRHKIRIHRMKIIVTTSHHKKTKVVEVAAPKLSFVCNIILMNEEHKNEIDDFMQ